MAKKNKACLACGTKYTFCPDCSTKDKLAPSWKSEFCCEDCKDLWTTATKYNLGQLKKAEAKEIISALNLKPAEKYAACLQRDLEVILAEDKKAKRSTEDEIKD